MFSLLFLQLFLSHKSTSTKPHCLTYYNKTKKRKEKKRKEKKRKEKKRKEKGRRNRKTENQASSTSQRTHPFAEREEKRREIVCSVLSEP
jgi:hypothetical protein